MSEKKKGAGFQLIAKNPNSFRNFIIQEFIEAGMVLTCEPGIYIPEEGIGCRLENDYLLTKDGNINLTESMPIEIEDIEALMKKD